MKLDDARKFALSLPSVTEEPHFNFSSFRVRGKIFATVPPDGKHLHIFVDEPQREPMTATQPKAYEKLWWGKSVVGLRVALPAARQRDVEDLLQAAWLRRAPKALARKLTEPAP
jgi:hypothetical protein